MAQIECEVCIIGAGSAGLSVASGLSQLGLRTVLIEHREMRASELRQFQGKRATDAAGRASDQHAFARKERL